MELRTEFPKYIIDMQIEKYIDRTQIERQIVSWIGPKIERSIDGKMEAQKDGKIETIIQDDTYKDRKKEMLKDGTIAIERQNHRQIQR